MRKRQFYLAPWIASVAASVATLASAAGFDGGGTAAVLGQPLAFVTQVRLDPGESLEPACVAAEVMAGDRVLPASQVHTSIESQADGGARIRVATSLAVDEPVISGRHRQQPRCATGIGSRPPRTSCAWKRSSRRTSSP